MHFLRLYNTGQHRLIGGPMSAKELATLVFLRSSSWWWFISGSALMRPQAYNRLLGSLPCTLDSSPKRKGASSPACAQGNKRLFSWFGFTT